MTAAATDAELTYNSTSNTLSATTFSGALTGNASGLSGSPDITVGSITATGNVSVAGTLTYEDVTNVDSVGLITARNGIVVGSGITLSKDGDIFATGIVTAASYVLANGEEVGAASTENIRTNTNATFLK